MADEIQEIRTQTTHQGDTEVARQSVTRSSSEDGLITIQRIIYLIFSVIASLLAIRFVFSLFGANESNAFANFIYTVTSPLVAPFRGLFNIDTEFGVSRFEIESVTAIVVYGLVSWALVKALDIGKKDQQSI